MTPVGAEDLEELPSRVEPRDTIRMLEPVPLQPNERLIEVLEEYLEKARAGELVSLAFVGQLIGGEYVYCTRGVQASAVKLAGEAALLQREILGQLDIVEV